MRVGLELLEYWRFSLDHTCYLSLLTPLAAGPLAPISTAYVIAEPYRAPHEYN
jgi:hypothetical protein